MQKNICILNEKNGTWHKVNFRIWYVGVHGEALFCLIIVACRLHSVVAERFIGLQNREVCLSVREVCSRRLKGPNAPVGSVIGATAEVCGQRLCIIKLRKSDQIKCIQHTHTHTAKTEALREPCS